MNKKKWISPKNFDTIYNEKYGTKPIENYVTRDPSPSPMLHNFRTFDKKKWIAGNLKL